MSSKNYETKWLWARLGFAYYPTPIACFEFYPMRHGAEKKYLSTLNANNLGFVGSRR